MPVQTNRQGPYGLCLFVDGLRFQALFVVWVDCLHCGHIELRRNV